MNAMLATLILALLFSGLVWISVIRSSEDGFFTSLWTLIVLFFAYQFARLEWAFFVHFLTENGMSTLQAVSTGYWIGFLMIMLPGMISLRFLLRPQVPFPAFLEKYGCIFLGVCGGILLFVTLIQWGIHFELFRESFTDGLRAFRLFFQILGYRSEGFS